MFGTGTRARAPTHTRTMNAYCELLLKWVGGGRGRACDQCRKKLFLIISHTFSPFAMLRSLSIAAAAVAASAQPYWWKYAGECAREGLPPLRGA
jgi:hypothetical protein